MSVKGKRHVVHHRRKRHLVHHRRHRRHVVHHSHRRKHRLRGKVGLAAPPLLPPPGWWLEGGNATVAVCGATAAANGLLAAGGPASGDGAVAALHAAAGGDEDGVRADDLLDALLARGLAGVRAAAVEPVTSRQFLSPGGGFCQVAEVRWAGGLHMVLLQPAGWVSWGRLLAPFGVIERTWLIRW